MTFNGQIVEIVFGAGDPEEFAFASTIDATLKQARWRRDSFGSSFSLATPPTTGIRIFRSADNKSLEASSHLASELCDAGFDTSVVKGAVLRSQKGNTQVVIVEIGLRPLAYEGKPKLELDNGNNKKAKTCPTQIP